MEAQHLLLMDEAHNLAPAEVSQAHGGDAGRDIGDIMVDLVVKILQEMRATGQAVWLADQAREQLSEKVLVNAQNRVLLYSDSAPTRELVTRSMGGRPIDELFAARLTRGQAIIRTPDLQQPRLVALLPPDMFL